MTRAIQIAHLVLLLAIVLTIGAVGWRAWRLADAVTGLVAHANATVNQVNQTLETVNRPCGTRNPCGTLAEVAKTTLAARSTLTHLDMAAAHENRNLTVLDGQERQLFDDAHTTLQNASRMTVAASAAIQTTNDSVKWIQPLLEETTATVAGYRKLTPEIAETTANLNRTTANLAAATGDFKTKFHELLYPPKCRTKWCEVKKSWPYIRGASEMAAPAYWGWQLFQNAKP